MYSQGLEVGGRIQRPEASSFGELSLSAWGAVWHPHWVDQSSMCALARQHLLSDTGLEPRAELDEAGSPLRESGQRVASLDDAESSDQH